MMSYMRLITLMVGFYLYGSLGMGSEIGITYYELPVLLGEKSTPIIRLQFHADQKDVGKVFSGLTISFEGSTAGDAIRNVRVYATEADTTIKPVLNQQQMILEHPVKGVNNTLPLNYTVEKPGIQNFWISLGVDAKADLLQQLTVQLKSATLGDKPLAGNFKKKQQYRLAIPIRQHNQDQVHTSRIPGLATSNKGTLLAIYDARYESARDLQGHMDIAVQRSFDQGQTWERLQIALDMKKWGNLPEKFNGVSDAAILVDKKSGAIFIAGLWSHGVINEQGVWVEGLSDTSTVWNHQWRNKGSQPGFDVKQTSQFLITKSLDDGKTWSEPINLTKQCKKEEWWLWAPAPGQGITMNDGTLVFPSQGRDKNGIPFSNITYSKDGGKTWKTSQAAIDIDKGTTECAVVELKSGELMLNMRANRNRGIPQPDNGRAIATTRDLGETWQIHPTSLNTLIEPTCMASLHKHSTADKQEILFFCNPYSTQKRDHISVQASFDYGESWPAEKRILLDEWSGRGYSCITSVDQETIGIIYEGSQADMVFQKIPVEDFLSEK